MLYLVCVRMGVAVRMRMRSLCSKEADYANVRYVGEGDAQKVVD